MYLRKSNRLSSSFLKVIVSFVGWSFLVFCTLQCAQVATPPGGKKDSIAPKLIKTFPINQNLNFKGKEIELTFDEYIRVDNVQQQLLVTPGLEGGYDPKVKPYGLRIVLEKPLRPNTTYNFNFRNAFKDATEGNVAKNIRLVFSTGQYIDSLKVKGRVKNLNTNKGVLDASVGFYEASDTLNIKKMKPYYFVKTDSSGDFEIENMKAGNYRIYSFLDKNNNLLFNEKDEAIGFSVAMLPLKSNQADLNLTLSKYDNELQKDTKRRSTSGYYFIEYLKPIKRAEVTFVQPKDSMPFAYSDKQLVIYNTRNLSDTLQIQVNLTDSLERNFCQDLKIKFKPKSNRKEDTFKEKLNSRVSPENGQDIDLKKMDLKIIFSKPIQHLNPEDIFLLMDSTKRVPIQNAQLTWNHTRTELSLRLAANQPEPNELLYLNWKKGAFISIENDTLNAETWRFNKRLAENYGIISGKISNTQKKAFLVQLLNDKYEIVQELANQTNYTFEYVKAGTYFVRVVLDDNQNGRWDFGSIEKNQPSENIIFIEGALKLKPNFELTDHNIELK
jgi:Bacterial Ig-like domain/Polysaccharide lyase family 4, domain II